MVDLVNLNTEVQSVLSDIGFTKSYVDGEIAKKMDAFNIQVYDAEDALAEFPVLDSVESFSWVTQSNTGEIVELLIHGRKDGSAYAIGIAFKTGFWRYTDGSGFEGIVYKDTSGNINVIADSRVFKSQLDGKVNVESGKGLSTNDFNNTYKSKVDNMDATIANAVGNLQLVEIVAQLPTTNIKTNRLYFVPNGESISENVYDIFIRINNKWEQVDSLEFNIADYPTKAEMNTALNLKVDKIEGKGLSTEDYTTAEKTKLSGIAEGATRVLVDNALNPTSTNPVQNKKVYEAILAAQGEWGCYLTMDGYINHVPYQATGVNIDVDEHGRICATGRNGSDIYYYPVDIYDGDSDEYLCTYRANSEEYVYYPELEDSTSIYGVLNNVTGSIVEYGPPEEVIVEVCSMNTGTKSFTLGSNREGVAVLLYGVETETSRECSIYISGGLVGTCSLPGGLHLEPEMLHQLCHGQSSVVVRVAYTGDSVLPAFNVSETFEVIE